MLHKALPGFIGVTAASLQDISNTLWAYATLRHYPGAELLEGAARQAVLTIHRFKPQEVANTLWSYATLGHDPNNLLLDAMAAQMAQRILHFRPQVGSCLLQAVTMCLLIGCLRCMVVLVHMLLGPMFDHRHADL